MPGRKGLASASRPWFVPRALAWGVTVLFVVSRAEADDDLHSVDVSTRRAYLERAQVWRPIETASLDLMAGPPRKDRFVFDARVACDYVDHPDEPLRGATPKFLCRAGDDMMKVKYGKGNGEVYAEVAATRLFWALGFGADSVYPV